MEELNAYLTEVVKNSHKCAHCAFCHYGLLGSICFFAYECIQHDFNYYNEGDEEE